MAKTRINEDKQVSQSSMGKIPILDGEISKNLKFPKDIWIQVFRKTLNNDIKSQKLITQLSKATHKLFQPDMFKARLGKLLDHVLFGERDEVEKMLSVAYDESKNALMDPIKHDFKETVLYKLLCTEGIAIDPSNRTIEGTVFRMALGAKHVTPYKPEISDYPADHPYRHFGWKKHADKGIAEVIASYLEKLPQGNVLIENQRRAQFPESKNQETKEQKENRYNELFKPLDALEEEKFIGKTGYQYYFLRVMEEPNQAMINTLLPFANQAAYVYNGVHLYFMDKNKQEIIEIEIKETLDNRLYKMKFQKIASRPVEIDELYKIQVITEHLLVNENTEHALNQFKEKLKPKGIIKSGFHFDTEILSHAAKKYDPNSHVDDNRTHFKNRLFYNNVIGPIKYCLPSLFKQIFHQHFDSVFVLAGEKLRCGRRYNQKIPLPGTASLWKYAYEHETSDTSYRKKREIDDCVVFIELLNLSPSLAVNTTTEHTLRPGHML